MYVCLCKAITDREVRQALDEGCQNLRDLKQELGICTRCCKCAPAVKSLVDEHQSRMAMVRLARNVA